MILVVCLSELVAMVDSEFVASGLIWFLILVFTAVIVVVGYDESTSRSIISHPFCFNQLWIYVQL